ncbi:sulfite exporter TauE/SafE family protein [Undibacterium sp. SXout7W]|uniref:sulfite exporter TauE/SafE family protein n=1 Tax=Undibacterium sp. SXout7W TaxID=3413049 RepID=UPI003BF30587
MDTQLITSGLGMIVGLILALTGAGGGILSVPLLVFFLHLPMQAASPIGLLAVGLASGLGALIGLYRGIVRYRAAILMGISGMLAAPFGILLAQYIPNRPLLLGFAFILLYNATRTFRQSSPAPLKPDQLACALKKDDVHLNWTLRCMRKIAGIGFMSGLLSGLIGVGGGFVIIPSLTRHSQLDIRSIQATSLAVITLVSVSGVSAAALHGSLSWPVAIPFASGSIAGLLVGQMWANKMSPQTIKHLFAGVSLFAALMMLSKVAGISPV